MKKKAVALAVGALFAAPAVQAQLTMGNETTGTVQVYGKLYPEYAVAKGQGSSQPGTEVSSLASTTIGPNGKPIISGTAAIEDHGKRNAVDSQNSYLGFRGERSLGGALKGIWQIEQSVELDSGVGTWSSRNSFAGLSHRTLGTVKLGKMDTIYKEYGDTFGMFGISSGNFVSASNVLSMIGSGRNNVARFHERANSTIQYQTAEFAGFQAGVQYAPDEARGDPGRSKNANLWSYGIKWDSQMFYASVHQEIHNDYFGGSINSASGLRNGTTDPGSAVAPVTASTGEFNPTGAAHSRDTATRFSGEVRFSGPLAGRVTLDVARLKYSETGQAGNGKFQEYRKPNWAVGAEAGTGPWRFATQYVRAGAGACKLTGDNVDCSTDGLQSWLWTLGVRYRFDRQTFVYAIAAKLNNGPSAIMDNWAASNPNRGEDIKQAAIGVSYSF